MTAQALLRDLEARGFAFEARGDKLHVSAPAGSLTAEVKSALSARKADLLAVLRDGTTDGCACIACQPALWPNGYMEVTATWPAAYRQRFEDGTQAREAAGADLEEAKSLSYQAALASLNRDHRRGRR
jgi:hypothetical protein